MVSEQTVRELPLWTKFEATCNSDGEKVRFTKDGDMERVFVFLKGKRNRGYHYSIPTFLTMYTPVIKTKEEKNAQWHKKLANIEKRLIASGLWENIKEVAHNLQTMTKEEYDTYVQTLYDIRKLRCNLYVSEEEKKVLFPKLKETKEAFVKKYPFLKCEDGSIDYSYIEDWISTLKTKSMYFGDSNELTKKMISEHLKDKTSFSDNGHTSYDVSYQYDADKNRAWYSEEYRGCGNGHYYLALDSSMALFYEDD